MAKKAKNPTKLPWTPEQITEIEDRLAQLTQKLRDIRIDLKNSGMGAVEWKLGTFLYYLSELESMIGVHRGEFERQYAAARARATREQIKAQASRSSKKRQ